MINDDIFYHDLAKVIIPIEKGCEKQFSLDLYINDQHPPGFLGLTFEKQYLIDGKQSCNWFGFDLELKEENLQYLIKLRDALDLAVKEFEKRMEKKR